MAVLNLAILVAFLFYATTCVVGVANDGPDSPVMSPAESKITKRFRDDFPIRHPFPLTPPCLPANQVTDVTRKGDPCKCNNCGYHGGINKWCYTSDDQNHHRYCCHTTCTRAASNAKWYCKAGPYLFSVVTECNPDANPSNVEQPIPQWWKHKNGK